MLNDDPITFLLQNENVVISDATGCFSKTGCTVGVAIAISVVIVLVVIIIWAILRKRKSVDDCPDSPTGLRLISKTETLATFTWTPGPYPEDQKKFRLCYKRLEDKTSTFEEIKVKGKTETIKDLQPGCVYQCYVYAMTGKRKSENSKVIDFTTLGLPDCPTKFETIEVTENSFLLHWTPGHYRKYGQTFVLECNDTEMGTQSVVDIEENPAAYVPFEHRLESLSAGTEYQLMLYAKNKFGSSTIIGPIIETTLGLPDAPTHLQAVTDTVTETTVTLTWKPGKYRKYRQLFVISYRLKDQKDLRWTDLHVQDEHKPTMLYKVDNLKEGKSYEFKIHAKNSIGNSKSSNIISFETKGTPESPSELREVETERTSNSITIGWIPGTYRRDNQKFVINYKRAFRDGRSNKWKHKEFVDDGHSSEIIFKIERLRAATSYHIAINAINHIGTSAMSDTITVETKGLLPQPPSEFVSCNIEETKVQLSWKPVICEQKQSFYLTYSSEKDQCSELIPFDNILEQVEYSVSKLSPGTVYEFSLWAFFGNLEERKLSERCEIQMITTKGKPESPSELREVESERTSTSVTVSWIPGTYCRDTQKFVVNYRRAFKDGRSKKWEQQEVVDDGHSSEMIFKINDLSVGKSYHIAINAINHVGASAMSEIITVKTKGLPEDPVDFYLVDGTLTETTAMFCWKPGKYRKYEQTFIFSYWLKDDEENITNVTVDDNSEKTFSHSVNGLQAGKLYAFCIVADNKNGKSNISETLFVQTKGLPEDPVDFHLVDGTLTETTATFCWKPGKYRKYEQTFVISYWLKDDEENITNVTVDDNSEKTISHSVNGLQAGKLYAFCIVADNKNGKSNISETLFVQTKGMPDDPSDLIATPMTSTSISISWTPGEYRRDIQHFVIKYGQVTRSSKRKWKTCTHKDLDINQDRQMHYEISGLRPASQYEVYVYAENCFGKSQCTIVQKVSTQDESTDTE